MQDVEPGVPANGPVVYWIVAGRCSYIGATVDPIKRLRQHCGVISGGAHRTSGKLWRYHCVISGFRTWKEALCFEWALKFCSKGSRGVESRRLALESLMQKERWTSNSPLASEVPLTLEYAPLRYGIPPLILPSPPSNTHMKRQGKRRKGSGFVKRLHGVTY